MIRITEFRMPLDHAEADLRIRLQKLLRIEPADLIGYTIRRRAPDARRKNAIEFIYTIDAEVKDEAGALARLGNDSRIAKAPEMIYRFVTRAPDNLTRRPVVVGTGPCGLFAALVLAQMGFRPLVLERGRIVRERALDTFKFWKTGHLNPESNVQFGEGGAGTFSDGKLHSQIRDPKHYGRKVLEEFVAAGATPEILYVNKPHIGTYRLVRIVERMRASIESLGGEFRFESRVEDLDIHDGTVAGLILDNGERIECRHVLLAIGHSARDTFHMLHERGIPLEAKPFSIGLRIEHPQSLIDRCRLGSHAGHPALGAADYKLVHHCGNGRSVYSFCMCPGGTVLAAASEPGHLVTNGMSQYSRDERNANSGIVVGITPADFPGGPLAGIAFQRRYEEIAFRLGGENYWAPGQLVGDFLEGRASTKFGSVIPSYLPGVRLCDLAPCLPDFAVAAIREALPAFARQLRGFALPDAVLTAVETRTSSPVRIPRNDHCESPGVRGLYPAGEGAGYAGGILSSAIDGIKVAEALALDIVHTAGSNS